MNKIFRILCLVPLSFLMTGCWTSILTVAPTTERVAPPKTVYTTTVTTPAPKVTTVKTVTVTSYSSDPSFYLDLNAVAAAFAESRSVREFEELLNSSRYMINNLDLNKDGWIDYLRVIETHRGAYHTLLLQACLAPGVFQDVATLVAEHRPDVLYVEVIGDRYLYGYNYIVRPVFVKRPPMWNVYGQASYTVWVSPYYYGSFPSYYTQPKPVYLNHYQAYVTTYMTNHHYCHHCDNPSQPFYSGYTEMTRSYARNDYQSAHPGESFEQRVTHTLTPNGSGVTVRNAGQLRTETQRLQSSQEAQSGTRGTTTSRSSGTSGSTRSSGSTASTGSRTTSNGSGVTPRSSSSGTSGASGTSRSASATTATTRKSATQATEQKTATPADQKSARTTEQKAAAPSTTVSTRVSKSGTTRTTIRTTDASGKTTTVRRESASKQSNTSTNRAATTTTRSSSTTGTRSSGSSTTRTGSSTTRTGSSGATRR